jgi:hypothetical protein
VRGERTYRRAHVECFGVVDQQAHAHAAIGSLEQRLEHELSGVVLLKQEVLNVERALDLHRWRTMNGSVSSDRR